MEHDTADYEAPAIVDIASVHDLTLVTKKYDTNTSDGFEYNGILLTS